MLRAILALSLALLALLKAFTFRHVGGDDPTVSLYGGVWTGFRNNFRGDLPFAEDSLFVLARSENGFIGEGVYTALMANFWIVAGVLLAVLLLLGLWRKR